MVKTEASGSRYVRVRQNGYIHISPLTVKRAEWDATNAISMINARAAELGGSKEIGSYDGN